MGVAKVIFGDGTEIDLSNDTVTKDKVLAGYQFHTHDGEIDEGECTFDVDSSDCSALPAEVLNTKTFAANGQIKTGSMPNKGAVILEIDEADAEITIPLGFHDGSGVAKIKATELAKIIASNIKAGVEILGVVGSYTGEGATAQSKSVTPAVGQQVVTPDEGYDYLSQVTVAGIPVQRTSLPTGGTLLKIG